MYSSPSEIADFTVIAGVKKANLSSVNQFLLGVLAGAFIAFGAQAANLRHTQSQTQAQRNSSQA